MQKEFDQWNTKKKSIDEQSDTESIYFREADIWWCCLGVNIGNEQDGKGKPFSRPVLIVKKFNQFVFWAVPLSTKLKDNPYYVECLCSDGIMRAGMISQLRLVSSKRLTDKICVANENSFYTIKSRIKGLL